MDMWLRQIQLQHSESAIGTICSPTWLRALTQQGLGFDSVFPLLQLLLKGVV